MLPFHFSYGNSVLNSNLAAGAQLVLEDNFAFPQVTGAAPAGRGRSPVSPACLPRSRCCSAAAARATSTCRRLRYVTQAGGAMPRAADRARCAPQLPQAQPVHHVRPDRGHRAPDLPAARAARREARLGRAAAAGRRDRGARSDGRSRARRARSARSARADRTSCWATGTMRARRAGAARRLAAHRRSRPPRRRRLSVHRRPRRRDDQGRRVPREPAGNRGSDRDAARACEEVAVTGMPDEMLGQADQGRHRAARRRQRRRHGREGALPPAPGRHTRFRRSWNSRRSCRARLRARVQRYKLA